MTVEFKLELHRMYAFIEQLGVFARRVYMAADGSLKLCSGPAYLISINSSPALLDEVQARRHSMSLSEGAETEYGVSG